MANGKLLVNFLDSKNSTFTLYPINLLTSSSSNAKIQLLSIGNIHSGLKDFSSSALIGVSELLKEKKAERDSPDAVIINGGALPYGSTTQHIPRTRGPRRWDDMLAMLNDINNLRDASDITQVYLTRIFNSADENAKIIYVMGEDDLKYKTDIATTLNYDFVYKPEILNDLCLSLESEIESRIKIIEITRSSKEKIEKSLKALNSKKNIRQPDKIAKLKHEKELENNKNRLELLKNQQEMQELVVIRQKILTLYSQSSKFNSLDLKALKERKREIEEALVDTNKKIEVSKDIFSADYKKLIISGKKLSNDLKAVDITISKIKNSSLNIQMASKSKRIDTFTGTIPAEAQSIKLIEEISFDYFKYVLGFAFGRKREVLLVGKNNLNSFNFSKNKLSLKTLIANNPANNSNVFKMKSNSEMNVTIGNISRNLSFEPNLAVVGHTMSNSFTIIPSRNNSSRNMAISCSGHLSDPQKTFALWNEKIKTRLTSAFEKSLLFSGVTLISFDGINFTSDVIKHDYLVNKANALAEREKVGIPGLIVLQAKDKAGRAPVMHDSNSLDEVKIQKLIDEARIQKMLASHKLLSELREKDLKYVNLSDFAGQNKIMQISKISIASISDIHFGGGETQMELLKACIGDIASNPPNILILNGDIVEGNLNNYMNVLKENKKPQLISEYMEFLKTKNLTNTAFVKEMNAFMQDFINRTPIQNIDAQIEPFIGIISPAIDSIMHSNGSIVITSGNHYNKTYRGHNIDEAEKLGAAIKAYARGKSPSYDNIRVIHGADYGAGEFELKAGGSSFPVMVAHNIGKSVESIVNKLRRKNSDAQICVGSHWHNYMQINTIENSIEVTPSLTSTKENAFLESTNNSIGEITGYVHSEYEIGGNKVLRHKSELRSKDSFKFLRTKSGDLIDEFMRNKAQVKVERPKAPSLVV
ncbi:MAG: hypothetical protein M1331_00780 [Candidatus Marsarchaeota archaeon]|nr:hypothetical protein [Candidatus Marsarchaeota archaeon]MCL5105919.1 hypothetical protein [Candidatus Marsarchaeota archaeon]